MNFLSWIPPTHFSFPPPRSLGEVLLWLSWDKNYNHSPLSPPSTGFSIKQVLKKYFLIVSNQRSCGVNDKFTGLGDQDLVSRPDCQWLTTFIRSLPSWLREDIPSREPPWHPLWLTFWRSWLMCSHNSVLPSFEAQSILVCLVCEQTLEFRVTVFFILVSADPSPALAHRKC